MAQALVNHSLDSIAAGVTQQYQEGRFESQVDEMLNCLPSITRGVLRRNPIYKHDTLSCGTIEHAFTYSYDRGIGQEQYILVIPGDALGSWYVYNANDITSTWTGTQDYFKIPIGTKAKDVFEALTVGDQTLILNSTVEVTPSVNKNTIPTANYTDWAFYWIKLTTQVVISQETVDTDTGSLLEGYTYKLLSQTVKAEKDTRPSTATDPDVLTSYKIATKMASLNANWTADVDSAFVYTTSPAPTNWDWEDSNGSLASIGVWKTVESETDLPALLPAALDGFVVRVSGGSASTEDDYFLQYDDENKTWTECAEPGAIKGFTNATMPHVLYALGSPSSRTFVVDVFREVDEDGVTLLDAAWKNREVGTLETNEDPSFVGSTITNLFFHKNRLGFITGDNIIMSRTGDYGNFYLETMQTTLEDGPIDLKVATTNVVTLRHAIPTEDSLVVFADEAQFLLSSGNAVFGPSTATISMLSHYNYAPNMDAKALGNRIYFGSISGGYAQLFGMDVNLGSTSTSTSADTLTLHIPSYINKGIDKLVGHDVLGQLFLHSENIPNILYVVSSAEHAGKQVQQAFHTWEFEENITGVHIINNELYLIFEGGTLAVISLEIPGDIDTIDYRDIQPNDSYLEYISGIDFSQFYYRDANKRGTERGRFQLRTMQYSILASSRYQTVIRNNTATNTEVQSICFGPEWDDILLWDDTGIWTDSYPDYDRVYTDDDKITIMSSSKNVKIVFRNNPDAPSKGFELATANIEALFYQRSQRT